MKATAHKIVNRPAEPVTAAAHPVAATVQRAAAKNTVQTALRVSSVKDAAEQEAVQTAKKIVDMAAPKSPSPILGKTSQVPSAALQRSPLGQPRSEAGVDAEIQNSLSSGAPLPISVQRFMQPRFNADFSHVKVHTDERSAKLNRQLSARAFTVGQHIFFGRNQFQPDNNEGRELIAHELTHTIQQGAAIQRSADVNVTQRSNGMLQRWGVSDALSYFASHADQIPGFRMLTLILGRNPISGSRVERNAANIMRAVVEFLPGGTLVTQALDNHGILNRVGTWVEEQLRAFANLGTQIRDAIDRFLDTLRWTDVFDLGGVWDRARRLVTEPVQRVIGFVRNLITGIINFIKDAVLQPLARLAEGTRGYDLLRLVLGRDPITGDPYPRTPENVIGGFMRLIGQEEKWRQLQESRAIPRAWAWFQEQMGTLMGFVRQIPSLFLSLWESFRIADLLNLTTIFNRIRSVFGGFIGSFVSWATGAVVQIMTIIFEVLAPGAMPVLRRAMSVFRTIIGDPVRFVGNLVRAAVQGFRQFGTNILQHLINGLVGWLTGALTGAGLVLPERWDLRGILSLVLQILGLTWQNVRRKLVRVMGETAVTVLETGFEFVVTLVRDGPIAAWRQIMEHVSNLQDMVFGQIREWVARTVVAQAIIRIASMLNPAGAVIQAIIAIYNTIMFVRERMRQIIAVAQSIFDSIAQIAAGAVGAAANFVEQTMGRIVPVMISFLARLLGLGGISDTIRRIIERIRAPIDRALDRVVDWIAAQARRLGGALMSRARSTVAAVVGWFRARVSFAAADGQSHSLFFSGDERNAVLKVRSVEMTFADFINRTQPGTNPQKIAAKQQAQAIAQQIDTERATTTASTDAAEQSRFQGRKAATINRLLGQLAPHTALLMGPTIPDSGSVQNTAGPQGLGGRMSIKPLTNQNRAAGSSPTSESQAVYDVLNLRRTSSGASYYIRGHLLNEQLGGPGNWINMTPLSRSGNARHERRAESTVKRSVDLPSIVEYEVEPVYPGSRSDEASLISQIDAGSDPAPVKDRKKEVVRKEKWVPTELRCAAWLLDESLARTGNIFSESISNPLQREPGSYYVEAS